MPARRGSWTNLYDDEGAERIKLTSEMRDAVALWFSDVWEFCTGHWPLETRTGQKGTREPKPILWTQDKFHGKVRPFPAYPYLRDAVLRPIFHASLDGDPRHRFTCRKPRQFFVSNAILSGGCLWDVLAHEAIEWLIAKNKLPESQGFVQNRTRFTYNRLPLWFREWRPVRPKPAGRFHVPATESRITAVASTFGTSGEAIGETAKILFDEAPRIRRFRAAYIAADAQAPVIVAVSAPPERGQALDPESLAFFRELAEGRDDGELLRMVLQRSDWEQRNALVDDDGEDDEDVSASALLEAV